MNDESRQRAAQAIISVPLFDELFDEIENTAMSQCINAKPNDDETRRNAAAEVRAIRKVRSRVASLAEQATPARTVPA